MAATEVAVVEEEAEEEVAAAEAEVEVEAAVVVAVVEAGNHESKTLDTCCQLNGNSSC